MWFLVGVGGCLLGGLFTRLACVLAAGFLVTTYLNHPAFPWYPQPPGTEGNPLFVNKNMIECLALLALAVHADRPLAGAGRAAVPRLLPRREEPAAVVVAPPLTAQCLAATRRLCAAERGACNAAGFRQRHLPTPALRFEGSASRLNEGGVRGRSSTTQRIPCSDYDFNPPGVDPWPRSDARSKRPAARRTSSRRPATWPGPAR